MTKIIVAIPVFNRSKALERLSYSLQQLQIPQKWRMDIVLFDDGSTDFGVDYLVGLFPKADIQTFENNVGADLNTVRIFEYFSKLDADILMICDSDLIIHPKAFLFLENNLIKTDGILSLLNASTHVEKREYDKNALIERKYVGAAGCCFTRKAAVELLENIPSKYYIMWDWAFSAYMARTGKRIYVSKRSYVLHTGIDGENSEPLLFDFSLNYQPDTPREREMLEYLNRVFVERYLETSDMNKIGILLRKALRKKLRRLLASVVGDERLIAILGSRKRRLRNRKVKR